MAKVKYAARGGGYRGVKRLGRGEYLEVEQGSQHGLAHPLLLADALVEDAGVLLAGSWIYTTPKGVAVPPIKQSIQFSVHASPVCVG